MELIEPKPLSLAYTYASSPSLYPAWTSGADYSKGQRVHDPISAGGDGRDYEAQAYLENKTTRPSDDSAKNWLVIGTSKSDVLEYQTDTDLSEYEWWSSATSVSKGKVQFDFSDQSDYVATTDLTAVENVIRPSVAVLSDDEDIRKRWVRVGTANAFRMFDGEALTRTRADTSLTCTAKAAGLCDRVGLSGLRNIRYVTLTVNAGEKFPNPSFVSSLLTGWEGSFTYSSGRITSSDARYLMDFVVGKSYVLTATYSGNTGTAYLRARLPDLATTNATTSSTASAGTLSLTFTATSRQHYIQITAPAAAISITEVSAKQSGYTQEIKTADLKYSSGSEYKRVCRLAHTAVDSPEYQLTIECEYLKEEIQIGLMASGPAENLGATHVNVQDASDDYSRIVFDETYGTGNFLKRGYSRRLSVVLQIPEESGAFAHQRLRAVRATPCFWDLNNGGTDDDGLLLHGIAQRPQRTISGMPGRDVIRLELKGLVE